MVSLPQPTASTATVWQSQAYHAAELGAGHIVDEFLNWVIKRHDDRLVGAAQAPHIPDGIAAAPERFSLVPTMVVSLWDKMHP